MLKVIIAGSRTFDDYNLLKKECCKLFQDASKAKILSGSIKRDVDNIEVISGGARGADRLGETLAKEYC